MLGAGIFVAVVFLRPPGNPDITKMPNGRFVTVNFFQAETIAKSLWNDPSAQWSHISLDEVTSAERRACPTGCGRTHNGFWIATGRVEGIKSSKPYRISWICAFYPGGPTPIYVRVGQVVRGDPVALFTLNGAQ